MNIDTNGSFKGNAGETSETWWSAYGFVRAHGCYLKWVKPKLPAELTTGRGVCVTVELSVTQ